MNCLADIIQLRYTQFIFLPGYTHDLTREPVLKNDKKPDLELVEKLLASFNDDVELDVKLYAIDERTAILSQELREARQRGDNVRCDDIKALKSALLVARNKLL